MQITRIYMENGLRNYCHLIACEETNEALVLDPLDAAKCLAEADRRQLTITKIVNTHEHFDHIDGNPGVVEATGAKIHVHANAVTAVPNAEVGLRAGDVIEVGTTVRLRVLDTPGHTMAHVCLVSEVGKPALFSGDTLFNASVGNCKYGGDVHEMYRTFAEQLAPLPDETAVYPGHDYIVNNLNFSIAMEPDNRFVEELLDSVIGQPPDERTVTTMAIEKQVNPFLRLDNRLIIDGLKTRFADQKDDPEAVFTSLRAVRDDW